MGAIAFHDGSHARPNAVWNTLVNAANDDGAGCCAWSGCALGVTSKLRASSAPVTEARTPRPPPSSPFTDAAPRADGTLEAAETSGDRGAVEVQVDGGDGGIEAEAGDDAAAVLGKRGVGIGGVQGCPCDGALADAHEGGLGRGDAAAGLAAGANG
jgi:hypothetical protein